MSNFSYACIGTAHPGRPAWIGGNPYQTYDRPRGCVAVEDDCKTYFYRVNRGDRRAFRQWVENAFAGMNCNKLRGAWPQYQIERR